MHHQVRVAPDRRGEVAVARAREPRVAEVARRVVRLLERAQHERSQSLTAVPGAPHVLGHHAADLSRQLAGLLGRHVLRKRRRGHFERRKLSHHPLDRLGVGPLVHPVERGRAALRKVRGHLLVGEDHQLLDQGVRLRLRLLRHADDVAGLVELELRLRGRDLERAALLAPLAQGARSVAGGCERLRPHRIRTLLACEHAVHLVIGEPGVAADQRAVEAHARHPLAAQLHLHGHREALGARHERAGAVRQRLRQHRLDRTRHVHARAATERLGLNRAARTHERAHVGDVHPYSDRVALAAGGNGVIEVLGRGRVDREGGQGGEVAARTVGAARRHALGGLIRLDLHRAREGAAQPAVEHERLEHVARHVRLAERAHHARPALTAANEDHVPHARSPAGLPGE